MMHAYTRKQSHARRIIKKAYVNKTPAGLVGYSNFHIVDKTPVNVT